MVTHFNIYPKECPDCHKQFFCKAECDKSLEERKDRSCYCGPCASRVWAGGRETRCQSRYGPEATYKW